MNHLPHGTVILDEVDMRSYRILSYLGEGGFGTAYRAVEVTRRDGRPTGPDICVKLSAHADEWHGEVFFSTLLKGIGHVVEIHSAFPTTVHDHSGRRTVFAITMELVSAGTVHDECDRGARWTEEQIRKRVRLLLKPLQHLHSMGVSHRDVTPPNVFVGNRKVLKLGDFGISKAQLKRSGVHADVLNPAFAPKDLGTWWRPADDVYQVGLLMASLAAGEVVYTDVKKVAVNQFTTKGKLRDAIKAAISVKSQRPQSATELAALL